MCDQSFDWTLCLTQCQKIHVDGSFELYAMGSLVPCKVWLSIGFLFGMLVTLLSLLDSDSYEGCVHTEFLASVRATNKVFFPRTWLMSKVFRNLVSLLKFGELIRALKRCWCGKWGRWQLGNTCTHT